MKDIMLISLIYMASSETPIEQDVTLVVGGFLISGYVVSYDNYVMHHQTANDIEQAFEEVKKTSAPEGEGSADNTPNFIHLRDAKYFMPGANPIPNNMGIYVRIPLESVNGFSFGVLKAAES